MAEIFGLEVKTVEHYGIAATTLDKEIHQGCRYDREQEAGRCLGILTRAAPHLRRSSTDEVILSRVRRLSVRTHLKSGRSQNPLWQMQQAFSDGIGASLETKIPKPEICERDECTVSHFGLFG